MPLISRGTTVGMIGLGNREGGYRPEDRESAEVLAVVVVEALERKRVEERVRRLNESLERRAELQKSEEHYRTLFTTMREGYAVHEILCDADGRPCDYRFLDMNPAFEALTGLDAATCLGRTVREMLPGIEEHWITTYGEVALTGQPTRFENYAAPLGRWYEVMATSPARGQFATVFLDITDRKQAEEALRAEREKFERLAAERQAIVDSIADGLASYDETGRITGLNQAGEELLGYPAGALAGGSGYRLALLPRTKPSGLPIKSRAPGAARLAGRDRARRDHGGGAACGPRRIPR